MCDCHMRTGGLVTGSGETSNIHIFLLFVVGVILILYFTREHYSDVVVPGVFNRKYSIPSAVESGIPNEVAFMRRYKS